MGHEFILRIKEDKMKKIAIIVLIVLVVGIVGFYTYISLSVPRIEYVSDTPKESGNGLDYSVKRLYSSDIDYDKLSEILDKTLISTEFTEDDIYKAALAAGTPQFYPSFYFTVEPSDEEGEYRLYGTVNQEMAEGQTNTDFRCDSLVAECVASGFTITEAVTKPTDSKIASFGAPVLSEDGTNLAFSLGDTGYYEMLLKGTSGTVRLQFLYNVNTNSIFTQKVLEEQVLVVEVSIAEGERGIPSVTYTLENYSSTEDFE